MTEHQIQNIAKVCHEANRAYCETLQDYSQPTWEKAPVWQRESAIMGVRFHIAHPEAMASASHDSWLKVKRDEGWTYGPVKDPEKKQHPCMVEFDQLPYSQQLKDYIFRSIIHAFIRAENDRKVNASE